MLRHGSSSPAAVPLGAISWVELRNTGSSSARATRPRPKGSDYSGGLGAAATAWRSYIHNRAVRVVIVRLRFRSLTGAWPKEQDNSHQQNDSATDKRY